MIVISGKTGIGKTRYVTENFNTDEHELMLIDFVKNESTTSYYFKNKVNCKVYPSLFSIYVGYEKYVDECRDMNRRAFSYSGWLINELMHFASGKKKYVLDFNINIHDLPTDQVGNVINFGDNLIVTCVDSTKDEIKITEVK